MARSSGVFPLLVALAWTGAAAAQPLAVEWADRAKDRDELLGDPLFVRKLYCPDERSASGCQLMVISVGRVGKEGPLLIDAVEYRAGEGLVAVSRVKDVWTVELNHPASTTRLNITLRTSAAGHKIVDVASGVIISRPLAGEATRVTELAAFTKNSGAMFDGVREHLEVELGSSRITVVAAKRVGK